MKIRWWSCWQRLMMVVFVVVALILDMTTSDPQIYLIHKACSGTPASVFTNLNSMDSFFADIRRELSNKDTHYAIRETALGDFPTVYIMVQCRIYLSAADCVGCFDTAVSELRTCPSSIGAHITYDGCFLRYEIYKFDDQAVQAEAAPHRKCGNQSESQATAFNAAVKQLLADLKVATPKIINGSFAAAKSEVAGGSAAVYAVAQCIKTLNESRCQYCLTVAHDDLYYCVPAAYGRAFEVGCFLRYSKTPFFADNQTINITHFLGGGSTGDNGRTPFLGEGSGSARDGNKHRLAIIIGNIIIEK
ncbi:cysteine-rich receptor-like protein kinase 42 [Cornus florida]|uniref:cysteine-rich receptor-like protein kinase 42 n=1 Tax=Cornus florida TaxID=4283 RepID=UPI00289ED2CF|nr:cysteine-rich receptor-like protein kinase 42 [Cornus florida]XP_059670603.1 cysteine-rich receptor-like protein kinase 42 [Cornus florida]